MLNDADASGFKKVYLAMGLSSAFHLFPIIIVKILSKLRIIIILFHRS